MVYWLRVFWLLLQKFNFWKGDCALGYISMQIWDFPDISLFPKILSLKSFVNLWGNSYQTCHTRYHVLFYLWLIRSVHCKVPKYYDQDCLKKCFSSLPFQWWFKFLEKMVIWFKKVSSVKTLPVSNGESFLEPIFDLN